MATVAPRAYRYEQVIFTLRDYIARNDLRAGDPLPSERHLCDLLGVSRTSLREGVRALVHLGVIEVKNGEGMFVGGVDFRGLVESIPHSFYSSEDDLLELLEIRQALEVLAAIRAATRVSNETLATMETVLTRMELKIQAGEYSAEEDREFHELILDAAESPLLTQFLGSISDLVWLIRKDLHHAGGPESQGLASHRRILDALYRRDSAEAGAAMRTHLETVRSNLRQYLSNRRQTALQ